MDGWMDGWTDGWGIHYCYCCEVDVVARRTDGQVEICLLRIPSAAVEFLFLFRVASDESWMGVIFVVVGWMVEYEYSSVTELWRGEGYLLYILWYYIVLFLCCSTFSSSTATYILLVDEATLRYRVAAL
ncbi:hypothetical protein B9Z19DRAFT_188474 [Tuber borchii]|uniref:Uncharacterized protein n=1 Tax=Tuber borchii TaxID=42251 RepID=A0A2T7A6A0_TUBBO|nr:hypothetical protein B9Z19DRAFT_188474 [Tuber borchii]